MMRNVNERSRFQGRGTAAAYERVEHDRQILRLLARGEKGIAAGKGFDLDAVLAEADALLEEG